MKRQLIVRACGAALVAGTVFFAGLKIGEKNAKLEASTVMDEIVTHQLGFSLFVLNERDNTDSKTLQDALDISTIGYFARFLQLPNLEDTLRLKFRCGLMRSFEKYSLEKKIFDSGEYKKILVVPDVADSKVLIDTFFREKFPRLCPSANAK